VFGGGGGEGGGVEHSMFLSSKLGQRLDTSINGCSMAGRLKVTGCVTQCCLTHWESSTQQT
jgi:hypothetical protein